MSSRDVLLDRIRTALGPQVRDADEEIDRRYRRRDEEPRQEILARFAERVAEYRATVRRIEARALAAAIAESCHGRGLRSLAVPADVPQEWLPGGIGTMRDTPDSPLTREQLDAVDGVLTGCAVGIAEAGTIILDGAARQGRRAITLLPDYHLCVVFEDQVVGLVPEAIELLGDTVRRTGRPITFISGPSATSDIELNRVEGVHGPRTLEVLLVSGRKEG